MLQAGNIGEYASPAQLLASEDGMFTSMVNETGPTNSDLLKKLAKSAAEGSIKVEDLVNAGGIVATAAASEDVKDAVEV